jgi:diguanylate cyclase (GGDEF)-like protein/PAS domain S-box-containing protein
MPEISDPTPSSATQDASAIPLAATVDDENKPVQADALQSGAATFHGLFQALEDALFVADASGRILDANPAAERLTRHSRDELIGNTPDALGAADMNDLNALQAAISAALAGRPQEIEFSVRNHQGHLLLVYLRLSGTAYFGQPAVIMTATDISRRKAEERRLIIERDLSSTLIKENDRDTLLRTMLEIARRYPEFDCAAIHWQGSNGGYELLIEQGFPAGQLETLRHYPADGPLAACIRAGQIARSSGNCSKGCNCGMQTGLADLLNRELGSLIVLPITVEDQTVACITLGSRHTQQIPETTCLAVQNMARHFALALAHQATQESANQSRENLAGLFDALPDFIFILDESGRILHHNRTVSDLLGYRAGQLIGQPISTVHPENLREMADTAMHEMLNGKTASLYCPLLRLDGRSLPAETRIHRGRWNGAPALIRISQDISERVSSEEKQRLAASVFAHAHEGIMITDVEGHIVEVNPTFTELTGFSRAEALGRNADLLNSGHHDKAFYQEMWRAIYEDGFWRGEVWNRKKSGEIFVELLTISAVRDTTQNISHYVAIFSDITLIKEHQQRLEHLAHFDALTQLPNRMLLADRLQLAMAHADRNRRLLAVCYLDLDGFKPVNDTYGHSAGDRLLIEVAQRLKACVRGDDTVARLGGDECVLLLSGLVDVHECDQALKRVSSGLTQPFHIGGHEVLISASIGVTLYPQDGSDADTLLRHADQAMYVAKQAGRNRHHLFDPENDRRARRRRDEVARIHEGLQAGEFVLYHQPKVDMRQGRVVGAEALIRWQHPEHGLLQPAEFLPATEGNELAVELGDWVIRAALDQLAEWAAAGIDLELSINIAGEHLQHPGFARELARHLAAHPTVPPERLALEVLETAAIDDIAGVADLFGECRKLGVSFALDDFGTGYSSLTYFRRLPAEMLKIDQSFVRDMLDDPEDLAIVEGVIGLTRAFKRKVIAEGVETVEHGLVLLLLGCDLAQGYGIARPMPAAELPAWIAAFRPDELWGAASAFEWSREDLPMLIAEVDHRRWLKTLEKYMDDATASAPLPELDDHACGFGRWYHGAGSRRYKQINAFRMIDEVHHQLHQIARQMLELQHAGKTAESARHWPALRDTSLQLSELLQQLQAEILIGTQLGNR